MNLEHTATDTRLIREAIAGNKSSLEQLIGRYQNYVYNIALRMFLHPEDARDATQEILIKVITSLKTFKEESKFSTWLYRITVNHFLNRPQSKTEVSLETNSATLAGFSEELDSNLQEALVEEVRVLCSTAMLMCLSREQRLLFIIGEIFETNHTLGAELFGITPGNYRIKLHRAKADLLNFVSNKCGIINPANPCRCPKKAKTLLEKGLVDKSTRTYTTDFKNRVADMVKVKKNEVSDTIQLNLKELFQNSPFQIKQEVNSLIEIIVRQVE